ncbi:hypothetical protein CONLIGDRAFT_399112 [Coniochaeta ligniaria NRRL 30616]|uniref:Secreted protein n=1 Tax=Coniochaeta ligniaria NRRL 30616 TaxID=1408157 RepID=A0A1J7IN53_9PEZI|nr:hypothetical protein CONLIGDRAFT_399112 [Coniochaeta ligniaria NRRL 30616]
MRVLRNALTSMLWLPFLTLAWRPMTRSLRICQNFAAVMMLNAEPLRLSNGASRERHDTSKRSDRFSCIQILPSPPSLLFLVPTPKNAMMLWVCGKQCSGVV